MRAGIRKRLAVFVVLSAVAVAFTGARYAQLTDRILSETYTVSVDLPTSGGLFAAAEVTYRGVPIGRVTAVDLTEDGVVAKLAIRNKWKVPEEVVANVHNRSAVGEQYIDLVPKDKGGPYLADGDKIARESTTIPLAEEDLILTIDRFARTVDIDDMQTVVKELGAGFQGSGGDIGRMLDGTAQFVNAASANLPATVSMLENTRTVMRTQLDGASDFSSFAHDLALFTTTFRESDADIRTIIRTAPPMAREATGLFNSLSVVAPMFLQSLIAVNAATGANLKQLAWGLAIAPWDVAAVQSTARNGFSYLGLALNAEPEICQKGYLPTDQWRSTNDLSVVPAPYGLRCAEPDKVWRGTNRAQ